MEASTQHRRHFLHSSPGLSNGTFGTSASLSFKVALFFFHNHPVMEFSVLLLSNGSSVSLKNCEKRICLTCCLWRSSEVSVFRKVSPSAASVYVHSLFLPQATCEPDVPNAFSTTWRSLRNASSCSSHQCRLLSWRSIKAISIKGKNADGHETSQPL